jgi:signal transduction histidine kinase
MLFAGSVLPDILSNEDMAAFFSIEHFQKYCSHSGEWKEGAVFLDFGFVSAQLQGCLSLLLRRSLAKTPKILVPNGYSISPNAPGRARSIPRCLVVWLMVITGCGWFAARADDVLTNASQIRNLSYAEAASAMGVRLRGVVVTEAGPAGNLAVVIADETADIYVLGPTNSFADVHRGDLLEIEGVTDPGEFAPIVLMKKMRQMGTGPIPKPREVTFEQMSAGRLDGQLVEVSGVVRSWAPITDKNEFGLWHMDLAVGGGRLTVSSNREHPSGVEQDAEVTIQGVCFYQFNARRQVLSPLVFISRDVAVKIQKPAPADPFASPVREISSLLQFSPSADYKHRVHARGTVTYQQPGLLLWLRENGSGCRVQSRQAEAVQVGDDVDAVGYLRYGAEAPILEDAVFRRRNSGPAPPPVQLGAPAEAFDHEEDLVCLTAVLTEVQPTVDGWTFTFEKKGSIFKAVLRRSTIEEGAWRPGSRVRVAGICSLISDDSRPVISGVWHPRSFQILLRSPEDLTLIAAPPWWTPSHIILLFAIVAGTSLAATALVMFAARRRLREQAVQRAMAEAEFTAILSERNRMAREIHDTLAQGLAATSVQLTLAKKNVNGASEALGHHLDTAQELVRESLAEARDSIWNMRSHVLESRDLAGALREILKQRCEGTGIETSVEVSGPARRFAPITENNLLRIGQEAIFNATKYAEAKHIGVKLEFGEKEFRMVVKDNGCGFDTSHPPAGSGGFGLMAMRERAAELKGELQVHSDREHGTEITFSLALSGE